MIKQVLKSAKENFNKSLLESSLPSIGNFHIDEYKPTSTLDSAKNSKTERH